MIPENLFNPSINVNRNTQILSNLVTLSYSGTVVPVSQNVIVRKNGQSTSGTVEFNSGDTLQVEITSSENYSDQVHGIIQLTSQGKTRPHIFTCVTLGETRKKEEYADLEPFEFFDLEDETTENSISSALGNVVYAYGSIADDPFKTIEEFNLTSSLASSVGEIDSLVFCSFFTKKVFRINISTNEISGIIDVSGNPFGAVGVAKIPDSDYISNLWITLTDQDKVIVLDNQDQVVQEFSVGNRPLGIATNSDTDHVWVANSYSNTVTHFKWIESTQSWSLSTVSVGEKPYEIACDTKGCAWIACAADNKVYRITEDDVVSYYVVGDNPRGIAYNSEKIWIAISKEDKIVALNLDGSLAHTIEDVGQTPFAVGSIGLPFTFKLNITDVINILDKISTNLLTEPVSLLDRIASANPLLDNIIVTESLSFSIITDSVPPVFEEPQADKVDTNFNCVSLLLNGEEIATQSSGQSKVSARYLIVEVQDYHAGIGGAINELIIKDENGNTIPYTVYANGAYDLTTNDVPEFWNNKI